MRAFLIACVVAVVMAIGAAYVLDIFQHPTDMAVKIDSVRLSNEARG